MDISELKLENIDAGYGDTQIIWNLNITCEKKTLTVIVGPNGAGKTTTLKVINGLLKPWKGKIFFKGNLITNIPSYKRVELGISSVPEGRRLFPDLTAEENLRLGAYTIRARRKVNETLKFVYELFPRLKERANVKAGKLSGGEQQMLAIGRALMSLPSLLLLDEPSLGLAPKVINSIFETINKLKDSGLTILLVEQNAYKALEIADFAYIMQSGRIVNFGKPENVMNLEELKKSYFSISR
jgi:branched-chain amino acid transport system ATP-binding protein